MEGGSHLATDNDDDDDDDEEDAFPQNQIKGDAIHFIYLIFFATFSI